jgi:hypothetical protein
MKNIFALLLILLFFTNLKCQNLVDYSKLMFDIKFNNYNALYYDRANRITIKYDTSKYKGEILCEFDTSFKNVKQIDKNNYSFFIDDITDRYENNKPRVYKTLDFFYKINDTLIKLTPRKALIIDTNTWFSNLICDNFLVRDNIVYRDKFLSFLLNDSTNHISMIYFVKNDQIIDTYKRLDYCISGFFKYGDDYVKMCTTNSKSEIYRNDLVVFLKFLSDKELIYIENIEVIDNQGKKIFFPPMSFKYFYY